MTKIRQVETVPFPLDKILSREYYRFRLGEKETRPTITIMARDPKGHLLLVLPSKATKNNAFMFPQGPIKPHETPVSAMFRVLSDECQYQSEDIDESSIRAVGVGNIPSFDGDVDKIHHVVFVSLRRHSEPALNHKNSRHVFVAGPNFLWEKIIGCRGKKRRLIISSIYLAVNKRLLVSDRWGADRFNNLRQFAIASSDD